MNTEREKFAITVTGHQDRVYALALAVLRDADDASDVAQEAFVKLWHKGHDLPHSAIRPWLLKVTHNLCLDHIRRTQRQHRRLGRPDHEAVQSLPAPPIDPDREQLPPDLTTALAALPPETRSMMVMHYCEGFKLAEIAAMLETSIGAVKVRLHRARKTLRHTLAPKAATENCKQETGT